MNIYLIIIDFRSSRYNKYMTGHLVKLFSDCKQFLRELVQNTTLAFVGYQIIVMLKATKLRDLAHEICLYR